MSVVGYGLENNVKFEPAVDHDTLFSYYKTADLFLLTSNYEGYGRSVIEAMTAGLPVVMTDVGLAREIVINGENGVVVPVGDTKAIVDSIGSLIDDRGKETDLAIMLAKPSSRYLIDLIIWNPIKNRSIFNIFAFIRII